MRGQNRSSAVMQQRSEPHNSLDDFPTPPWATRAIIDQLSKMGIIASYMTAREPCANRGYMVRPMEEYFSRVFPADIHDYGAGYPQQDYLFGHLPSRVDVTMMNPPFRLAQQFIERGIETSGHATIAVVRSAFLEGVTRYEQLFRDNPPSYVFQHSERVPMVKGRYDPKASTATCYCWLVWCPNREVTEFHWIPQCRKKFEREGDAA